MRGAAVYRSLPSQPQFCACERASILLHLPRQDLFGHEPRLHLSLEALCGFLPARGCCIWFIKSSYIAAAFRIPYAGSASIMALAGRVQACLGMDEKERPVDCYAADEAFSESKSRSSEPVPLSPNDTCKLFVEKTA